MATLVLTTVGRALGGPIGGAIGAVLGQAIDGRIFAPPARQGPRLADLAVQTSTYGAQLPKLFGRTRVSGTVIWSTDLIETTTRTSSGKGRPKTDSYSYAASFAVALSGRRILRVERIWADGKLLRGTSGDLKVSTGLVIYTGDPDQPIDPLIASAEGIDATSAHRGTAYAVFDNLQLADFGNRIPSLSFEVVADEVSPAVGDVVADLAGEGVGTDGGATIGGFAATGSTVRQLAENLAQAYSLTSDASDGHVVVRSAAPCAEAIDDIDLGARSGANGIEARFGLDIAPLESTPVALTFGYADSARDYQAGVQRARRDGPGEQTRRVELPVTLVASAAHATAEAALAREGRERVRATVTLPWRYLTLRPGRTIDVGGERWRVREARVEGMVVKLALVRAAGAPIAGRSVEPGRSVSEIDLPHGPTTLVALDLPPLGDIAASQPQIGVFANGSSGGWRRAALLASVDGGASYVEMGATARPAIIGATVGALGAGSCAGFDRIGSIALVLAHERLALHDADDAALLAGANRAMIGRELVQFGRAVRTAPGRYTLSRLLRGRRGTEDAVGGHVAGEAFVLIEDDTIATIPAALARPGVKLIASGIGDADPFPAATVANIGRSAIPFSPVHLRATRLPSGDMRLDWIRRSREGLTWVDGVDAPIAEERESYRVTRPGGSVDVSAPTYTYTAAQRAADASVGSLTVNFEIAQIGAGGVSAAATIIVPTA